MTSVDPCLAEARSSGCAVAGDGSCLGHRGLERSRTKYRARRLASSTGSGVHSSLLCGMFAMQGRRLGVQVAPQAHKADE